MDINNGWEFFGIAMIVLIIFIVGAIYGNTLATERAVEITEEYYGNATKEYFLALLNR